MYIPYEKIGQLINKFLKNDIIKDYFYNKKIDQNIAYIEKNKNNVIKKLKKKFSNNEKINIVFYIYDEAKWKCQTLYDLLDKDERFNVKILVTGNSVKDINNPSFQTIDDILKCYNLFLNKGLKVELAYDIKKNTHIAFEKYKPDIIIYQHPWYVETSQGPVVCSKFALTCYIPYFVVNYGLKQDYYLRFHQYVENHYLLNKQIVDEFSSKMSNGGKNLKAVGHPQLDFFYYNKENFNKKYVIYAPHWTVNGTSPAYGTFEWNGKFLLEYAKKHPEFNWVFKPHPLFKKAIIDKNIMNKDEIEEYFREWRSIGIVCEDSNYLDLFSKSRLLITDCGSFLTEYFLTKNPVIHILSQYPHEYGEHYANIVENYYQVKNLEELNNNLEEILINNNDILKEQRENAVNNCGFYNTCAAENIIIDIINEIE